MSIGSNKSGVGHSISLRKALEVRSVNDISIKDGAAAVAYEVSGTSSILWSGSSTFYFPTSNNFLCTETWEDYAFII